jgi:hypothetical protein
MKRILFALAALILPQSAFAGFGTTGYLLSGSSFVGAGVGGLGGQVYGPIMSGLPTLDYHSDPHLVQIDVLGLISSITAEDNFGIDAAYYYTAYKGDVHDNWKGTVSPGVHLGYWQDASFDQSHFDLLANLRMGVQAVKQMGVGLYVVPGIGIRNVSDDDLYLAMSGGLELSVWLTGAAGN